MRHGWVGHPRRNGACPVRTAIGKVALVALKAEQAPARSTSREQTTRPSYDASDITVLTGLEPVKQRPGMYIGSTGPSGLHHLVWEVVDNSVDEAMQGCATRIDVTLLADGGCRVTDNGRGIPVGPHEQYPDRSTAPSSFSRRFTPAASSAERATRSRGAFTGSACRS